MARLGNGAPLNGGKDRTAILLGVGALGVAALPDVGLELSKGQRKILFFKKVEAFKIEHGKAGRVGKIAAVILICERIKLGDARGVFSALDATADLSRLQL